MNILHAIQHHFPHFLQSLVPSHRRDRVSLNEDITLREKLDSFQRRSTRTENSLSTLDEAIVVSNDVSNLDDIAHDVVFENSLRLRENMIRMVNMRRERNINLKEGDTSSEELDEIARFHDDVRIKRLPRRIDRHGTFDQIQHCRNSLFKSYRISFSLLCNDTAIYSNVVKGWRMDRTYMLLESGTDMTPDLAQIDFAILGKESSETALLEKVTSLIPVLLQLLERENRPMINIVRIPRCSEPRSDQRMTTTMKQGWADVCPCDAAGSCSSSRAVLPRPLVRPPSALSPLLLSRTVSTALSSFSLSRQLTRNLFRRNLRFF